MEDIEELRSQKNIVLQDMYCETDKQVASVEQRRKRNTDMLKQLDKRNLELAAQKKHTAAEFEEVRSDIPAEDTAAVQEERLAVRDEVMSGIRSSLQEMYGRKYSYEEFKTAVDAVSHELNEAPLPRKSVRELLQKNQQKVQPPNRTKQREQEL